jgi:epoxyqueuosine reductase
MPGTALKEEIVRHCTGLDIPLVGFAPVERWDVPLFEPWVPAEFRPCSIVPGTKTVIVIGMPVHLPAVDTAPSIWYHELYRTVNTLLDQGGYRLATFLTEQGAPSAWIPRDGYGSIEILKDRPVAFFSHRHAALLAGLGNFGINNTLLTPAYGPRVRFASIFTTAEIPPDPVLEKPLCTRCMRCVKSCPVKAIGGEDYPGGLTEKKACAIRSEALAKRFISPCGICLRVCPVGRDRTAWHREDMGMYDENNEQFMPYHQAAKHVRNYGSH